MYSNNPINVIELRNYLLKSGTLDQFIDYFENHFIDSQNELGGYVLGQFRIKDIEDDRFFWIRGFQNMNTRSRFLPAFYGGAVWKEFGPAANDMMLEWHKVHLLKPLPGNENINSNEFIGKKGIVVIDYYTAHNGQLDELIKFLRTTHIPFLQSSKIHDITLWISEMTENDFPGLPVIQDKNMLITITTFKDELEYQSTLQNPIFKASESQLQHLISDKNSLLLYPTDKSCVAK
jgi:hypothetical protein